MFSRQVHHFCRVVLGIYTPFFIFTGKKNYEKLAVDVPRLRNSPSRGTVGYAQLLLFWLLVLFLFFLSLMCVCPPPPAATIACNRSPTSTFFPFCRACPALFFFLFFSVSLSPVVLPCHGPVTANTSWWGRASTNTPNCSARPWRRSVELQFGLFSSLYFFPLNENQLQKTRVCGATTPGQLPKM